MTRILAVVLILSGLSARAQERSVPIVVHQGAQSPVLIVGAACVVAAAGFGVGWVIGKVVNACLGTNAPAQAPVFGPASVTGCQCLDAYSVAGSPLPLQLEWSDGTQWLPLSQEGLVAGSEYEMPENGPVRARVLPIGIRATADGAALDVPPGDLLESSDLVSWSVAGRYYNRSTVRAESGKFYRMKL